MAKNPTPVLVVACSPFSLFGFNKVDRYEATFDDMNRNSYDYLRFYRTTTILDAEFDIGVGAILSYTGCLLFPRIRGMTRSIVLDASNRILFRLFFGGIPFEAPKPDDIGLGILHTTGYFRCVGGASGDAYSFIHALQNRMTGQDRTPLLYKPRFFTKEEVIKRYWQGRKLTEELGTFNPKLWMEGYARLISHECESSLLFSWCFAEQIIEKI